MAQRCEVFVLDFFRVVIGTKTYLQVVEGGCRSAFLEEGYQCIGLDKVILSLDNVQLTLLSAGRVCGRRDLPHFRCLPQVATAGRVKWEPELEPGTSIPSFPLLRPPVTI